MESITSMLGASQKRASSLKAENDNLQQKILELDEKLRVSYQASGSDKKAFNVCAFYCIYLTFKQEVGSSSEEVNQGILEPKYPTSSVTSFTPDRIESVQSVSSSNAAPLDTNLIDAPINRKRTLDETP